jgi:hypothetical protein
MDETSGASRFQREKTEIPTYSASSKDKNQKVIEMRINMSFLLLLCKQNGFQEHRHHNGEVMMTIIFEKISKGS